MTAIDELRGFLPARVQKTGVIARRCLVFRLASGPRIRYLYLAPDPAFRAAVLAHTSPQINYPAADWLSTGKEAELASVEKVHLEDVLVLKFSSGMSCAVHYFGKQGNAVLVDPRNMVVAVWHPIDKHMVGQPYSRSDAARGEQSLIRAWEAGDLLARLCEAEFEDVRRAVLHKLNAERKRLDARLDKIATDEQQVARAAEYRHLGELLKAHYRLLKRGMRALTVPDILVQGGLPVTIPLKPDKSPEDNVADYFKKAKKWERAPEAIAARRALTEREIAAVDVRIGTAAGARDVAELRALALPVAQRKPARRPRDPEAERIRRFVSSDEFLILAGRSAKDNDYLTMHVADGNDLWLHTHNRPGAHVIIRTNRGKEIPRTTLVEAAQVCVHLSKVADGELEDVLYTQRKHVSKPRNAKPGSVLVAAGKTLTVRQNKKAMDQWLRSHGREPADCHF